MRMTKLDILSPTAAATTRLDGSIVVKALEPLDSFEFRLADPVRFHARTQPERIAFADRKGEQGLWRTLTYADLCDQMDRLGQAYLHAGLGPDRPLLLVSENRLEAAIATFAAYRAGIPIAPMTPAYSAGRGDMERLKAVLETLRPGLAIVNDADIHRANLLATSPNLPIVSFNEAPGSLSFKALLQTTPGEAIARAAAKVGPGTIAKILFTSGSTGTPKGAVNTHGMLTSNVAAIRQTWPFLKSQPPIVVDWLPWNHTFGGNFVMNQVITSGGSLYIDDGDPSPSGVIRSIANAAEIRPTMYLNVPRGLDLAARVLEGTSDQAAAFFERLRLIFFASAGLPERIRADWMRLMRRYGQEQVYFCSAWGTTETSPLSTMLNFDAPQINNIGVPIPGVEIKLAPEKGRMELRVRGPNVTPGYLNRTDLTQKAFDEEGFWKSGDAGTLANPDDPQAGILIEGRLAEDFKLASGIWVNASGLRSQLLEKLGSVARDVVISGPQRDELGALIFLDTEGCTRQFGLKADLETFAQATNIHSYVSQAIDAHNSANSGNSRRIEHFRILERAPNAATGELTEKGTINAATVLGQERMLCDEMHRKSSPKAVQAGSEPRRNR